MGEVVVLVQVVVAMVLANWVSTFLIIKVLPCESIPLLIIARRDIHGFVHIGAAMPGEPYYHPCSKHQTTQQICHFSGPHLLGNRLKRSTCWIWWSPHIFSHTVRLLIIWGTWKKTCWVHGLSSCQANADHAQGRASHRWAILWEGSTTWCG